MIKQVRVSHGLRRFKPGIMSRWNLKDYHDINAPCLFLNINGPDDINAVKMHKGFKLIFFANARANQFVNHFIGVKDLVVMSFNPYLTVPKGMKHKGGLFELEDFSIFRPNMMGDKIYAYAGNNAQKHKYGYERLIKLQKRIKYKIIIGMQGHSLEFVKQNYYDNCFLNLNFNIGGGGGLITALELSFMGRKTIMNTRHSFDCMIPYKDDNDIIKIIGKEAQKIGTIQPSKDCHTLGPEWQNVKFWTDGC